MLKRRKFKESGVEGQVSESELARQLEGEGGAIEDSRRELPKERQQRRRNKLIRSLHKQPLFVRGPVEDDKYEIGSHGDVDLQF